jgi:hypothetical protein
LGAPAVPTDFFAPDDSVIVLFEKGLTTSASAEVNATAYRQAWRNTNAYLDSHYIKEKRYRLSHAPFALRKSHITFSESEFPFIFALNASHKFRSTKDYNITNGLLQYHWLYHDKVASLWGAEKNRMVTIGTDASIEKTKLELKKLSEDLLQSFCLQDCMDETSDATCTVLRAFLEDYYPMSAPWECANPKMIL